MLYKISAKITKNIIYFLPRNINIKQLCSLAGPNQSCEIEQAIVNDRLKVVIAYFGDLIDEKLFSTEHHFSISEPSSSLDNVPLTIESFLSTKT
jgi:hypothetical protein